MQTVETLFAEGIRAARCAIGEQEAFVPPTFFINGGACAPGDVIGIIPMTFESTAAKAAKIAFVRSLMIGTGVKVYAFVCEAWLVKRDKAPEAGDLPPSECDDRIEVMSVVASDSEKSLYKTFAIKRDARGVCVELVEMEEVGDEVLV